MNLASLKLIEELILPSGKWYSLEISHDTIYIDFENVELGNPNIGENQSISIRFSDNSFIMFFYDNIWDVEFLSNFNYNTLQIDEIFNFKVNNIKFIDFEYLDSIFKRFSKNKLITTDEEFDINNIRSDFFLIFEINNVAIVSGGNTMNFFNGFEKLDDYSLKELSNHWVLYFLEYQSERKILNKDKMCEIHIKGD